jgi:hypothetical protein
VELLLATIVPGHPPNLRRISDRNAAQFAALHPGARGSGIAHPDPARARRCRYPRTQRPRRAKAGKLLFHQPLSKDKQ